MRPCAILIGGIVCLMVSSTGPASADLLDQVAQATIRACDTNQFLGVAFLHERDFGRGRKGGGCHDPHPRAEQSVERRPSRRAYPRDGGLYAGVRRRWRAFRSRPGRRPEPGRQSPVPLGRSRQHRDCRQRPRVLAYDNLPRDALAWPAQRLRCGRQRLHHPHRRGHLLPQRSSCGLCRWRPRGLWHHRAPNFRRGIPVNPTFASRCPYFDTQNVGMRHLEVGGSRKFVARKLKPSADALIESCLKTTVCETLLVLD